MRDGGLAEFGGLLEQAQFRRAAIRHSVALPHAADHAVNAS
jgi:hypothetical protein